MSPAADGAAASTSGGAGIAVAAATGASPDSSSSGRRTKPVVLLVIGMAGSGKTTLIQRLNSHLHATKSPGYIINLDPAVTQLPYGANIDIRDTVKYKNVMKQYNLGPNGGILTSCNLFATRFDQVIHLCEKERDPPLEYIVVDTPGQIEIFTWSASGSIITELLASSFPTVVVYVVDTPKCTKPQTFMSNMLQACSILYKTKLPMILAFNKTDVASHQFATEWMEDFEKYQEALEADQTYAATLSRSLSMVLDEFYQNLSAVGVSALTGLGMDDFFKAVDGAAEEFEKYFVPELDKMRAAKAKREAAAEAARQKGELAKLKKDMQNLEVAGVSGTVLRTPAPGAAAAAGEEEQEEEEEEFDYHVEDSEPEEDDH